MKKRERKIKWFYWGILVLVFGTLLAFLIKTNGNFARAIPLIGDEPSYMAIADSLATYKTFNLSQTLQSKHYFNFFPHENSLHTVNLGEGKDFPKHGIGWPILMVPFFFFLKDPRILAMILQNIIVVLLAYNLFLWLKESKFNFWISILVPFVIIFTIPLSLQAHMVFSEPLAALILIYAIRKMAKPNVLSILGTLYLPWIHIKYLAFFPMLVLPFLRVDLKKRKLKVMKYWPLALICLSIIGLAFFNWYAYGTPFSGQEKASTFFKSYQGLFGILLNREDGLFCSAPIYLAAFLGMGSLWYRDKQLFWKIAYPVGILWLITGIFESWHGGQAPTARMILVTLPVLAPALGEVFTLPLKWVFRTFFVILLIPSLLLGLQGIRVPVFAIDKPLYDNLNILQNFYIPIDFERWFPEVHNFGWNLNLLWLLILIVLIFLGYKTRQNSKKLEKIDEAVNNYSGV